MASGAFCAGARMLHALDRPRLWRVTALLAAFLLAGLLVVAAQGSLTVIPSAPQTVAGSAQPDWLQWCTRGQVRADRRRLAFCARADGLVVTSTHGPGTGEAHVALIGDFHLIIVRLPDGAATPPFGSRIVAIGPLLRSRDGQREVQAFRLERG
jgi:hypothetical protein